MIVYQLQVRGPWTGDEWRSAVVGMDGKPRNFGTRGTAKMAMDLAMSCGGPFKFRIKELEELPP